MQGHQTGSDGASDRRSGFERRAGQPRGRRVLLAGGDASLRDLYRMTLESHGWNVEVAQDGHSILAGAQISPPDVLLLDTLPDLDETTFLVRLRAQQPTRDLAVIVIANSIDETATTSGRELGVLARLVKSRLTRERLSETMLSLLERRTNTPDDRRQFLWS